MEFTSEHVRRCAELFHTVSFGEARKALVAFLALEPEPRARTEALSLLLRVNIERDEPKQMEEMVCSAKQLAGIAQEENLQAALYHLGIVFLLADSTEEAESCFSAVAGPHGSYGIAAVMHKRRESETALGVLRHARTADLDTDLRCLMWLLEGNCLKGLGKPHEAMDAYQAAQRALPTVNGFYLKHWVFFGLATAHARRNEKATATTLLEALLSITHPVDFKRLHRLASAELGRLSSSVEVLFDPLTGDITCGGGYLSLRRKPTLINLLFCLTRAWPNVISKEEIYLKVWRGDYHPLRHDGLIYSHMQRLRQILAGDTRLTDFILTSQDGYRLNPEIRVKLKEEPHETHSPYLGIDLPRELRAGR